MLFNFFCVEKSVVAMTTGEFWMPDSIYIDILSRTMNVGE